MLRLPTVAIFQDGAASFFTFLRWSLSKQLGFLILLLCLQ